MFHEVKILDGKGKIKKVLSRRSLSKRHWNNVLNSKIKGIHIRNPRKNSKPKDDVGLESDASFEDSYFNA